MRATSASVERVAGDRLRGPARALRSVARVCRGDVRVESVTVTFAPSRAKKSAIVPPMFGPPPKTIATFPGKSAAHCAWATWIGSSAGDLELAPRLRRPALAQRVELAEEDAAQERDPGVGAAEHLVLAVGADALSDLRDVVLRAGELHDASGG